MGVGGNQVFKVEEIDGVELIIESEIGKKIDIINSPTNNHPSLKRKCI